MIKTLNECTNLNRILKELREVVEREGRRHMMDSHLHSQTLDLIAYEIIPGLEAELDWEPSDADLLGEPPLSSAEMHHQALTDHVALHS